jgi:DNA polymerase III epsilon subunit-like protein
MAPVTRVIALDTEATGLDSRASVWEIAACPWDPDNGPGEVSSIMVKPFGPDDYLRLPKDFQEDYVKRYDPEKAVNRLHAAIWLHVTFVPDPFDGTKPMLIGAVPGFDERLVRQSFPFEGFEPPWHYHTQDVETLAVGYLRALEQTAVLTAPERDALRRILTPPYDSTALSLAVGVEPPGPGVRHTAGGDARWAAEMWDAVHRGDPRVLSQYWEAAAEPLEETP